MEPSPKLPAGDAAAAAVSGALKLEGFFPEFSAEHLQKLFPRSGLYGYPRESAVMEQGEEGRDLFVVCRGSVRVQQSFGSAAASLATLGPGELLGEIALLKDGARTATVVAAEDCQVYRLAFEDLQYLLKNNPALGEHLRNLARLRQA
ncbi:MAG: cyclic nucleotide-binding domain-containing protein [Elusimicrobia bacterium]|nr:cyclic nucleotide-binding domain-containing protein [Elusimicrobiota bacterium]